MNLILKTYTVKARGTKGLDTHIARDHKVRQTGRHASFYTLKKIKYAYVQSLTSLEKKTICHLFVFSIMLVAFKVITTHIYANYKVECIKKVYLLSTL